MDNMPTPRLDDRLAQLSEKIQTFFRNSYQPNKYTWESLDANFRKIEESIASVVIYGFLGEEDGYHEQHMDNSEDSWAKYGKQLLDTAISAAREKGVDTTAMDNMSSDIGMHNLNSHGGDVSRDVRESKGREAVLKGLDVVLELFADTSLTNGIPSKVRDEFHRFYLILQHAKALLSPAHTNPDVSKLVRDAVCGIFHNELGFPPAGDYDYVLILPENPDEKLVEALKPLFLIMRWSIVIDFSYENGAFYNACKELENISLSNTALTKQLSEIKTNWLFMNGRHPDTPRREVRELLKKLNRHILQMKNIIAIDLTRDKQNAVNALEKTWALFSPAPGAEPSDNTTVFSIAHNSIGDLKAKLSNADYDVTLVSLDLASADFVSAIVNDRLLPVELKDMVRHNNIPYLSAGIKFLDTGTDSPKDMIWDSFYSGRPLSVKDLDNDCDVFPRGNGRKLLAFQESIKDALSSPEGHTFYLYHQPGAGGTTLVRRLAYNYRQKCQNPEVLPVFLSRFDAISTVDMIAQLSETAGARTTLLIVADDKEINETDFQSISNNIRKKGIHCVLLRISHVLSEEQIGRARNSFFLPSRLKSPDELERFDYKFKTAYGHHLSANAINASINDIHSAFDKDKSVEMIYYPYTFCEQMHEENKDPVFTVPDSFVHKWFTSIKSRELQDLCGYIALVYHFSASKAADIYSLSSVWQKDTATTLEHYSADDLSAMDKILKVSLEEFIGSGKSTLRAPRYAAFADKILNAWRPGWSATLSSLAVDFINALPAELTERDHRILMDMFIQQIQTAAKAEDESRRQIKDRFSLLIGHILTSEGLDGAKSVFKALMEKYDTDPFYRIHYARLLFEYAHSSEAEPDDANLTEANTIIREVLQQNETVDSFQHIAGMYWRRMAKAIARVGKNTHRFDPIDIVNDITSATGKALRCFEKCNEINHCTSSYGFVSTAELIISTLKDARSLLPPAMRIDLLDKNPYFTYMDILDSTLLHLSRPQFADEFSNNDKLDWLRGEYLKLVGDIDRAFGLSKQKFESASDPTAKCLYGRRAVSLLLERERKTGSSRYQTYSNMTPEALNELTSILKPLAQSGDLRSAEQYFQLCRYTRHDQLTDGVTFNALKQWEGLSIEKNSQEQQLMASFYLYVCYAVKVLNLKDESNRQLKDEYLKYRDKCRQLVENLSEESYSQLAFAGNEHVNTWDCILDPSEAYTIDAHRLRTYTVRCRRENALIVGLDGKQGDCEIRHLTKISFSRKGIHSDAIGNELKNGVIGFRFRGAGLYDFANPDVVTPAPYTSLAHQSRKSSDSVATMEEAGTIPTARSDKRTKVKTTPQPEIYRTESEMKPIPAPTILGKIDIDNINKRDKKKNKKR